jgi:hypothetical protein
VSLPSFTAQNLSNTMWAFERLGYPPSAAMLRSMDAMEGDAGALWVERAESSGGDLRALRLTDLVQGSPVRRRKRPNSANGNEEG